MKIIAVIPARLSSTRFPEKVLAKKTGKFLIQHTYEQAKLAKTPEEVIIAADDEKVSAAAESFNAKCILTSPELKSGTDRIAQAVQNIPADIIINIQGDEPEIDPAHIDLVAKLLVDNPNFPMATLIADFENIDQVSNPNIVKVVTDNTGKAVYFSRSPIPYDRENSATVDIDLYNRHIGIYAYRKDFLLEFTKMPQTILEKTEKLEQLRAIENGYEILTAKVNHTCDGIDTPEQYEEFVKRQKKKEGM
ncbi:MAG: 3-deoxy-manno-octulosonate cytidylyltransferase [Planctomycetes bacterium]|nr:3-deoxy-manno-octulosonate cytidylyltransferase [Planctomycetota bacterium]MBL7106658.1 3-deoxy-manno-octulosonate cytidylyltransferase [Phycisphaerae bacterium]